MLIALAEAAVLKEAGDAVITTLALEPCHSRTEGIGSDKV